MESRIFLFPLACTGMAGSRFGQKAVGSRNWSGERISCSYLLLSVAGGVVEGITIALSYCHWAVCDRPPTVLPPSCTGVEDLAAPVPWRSGADVNSDRSLKIHSPDRPLNVFYVSCDKPAYVQLDELVFFAGRAQTVPQLLFVFCVIKYDGVLIWCVSAEAPS